MNMPAPTSVAPVPAPTPAPAPAASAAMSAPPPAADPAPAPAPAPTDWTSGLKEETRGYVTNKGWKNTSEVLDSYQNLEKLVGAPQDKIIKIPGEDDKDGWNSVYSRLGRPQSPADYKIEAPKEGGSPEFAKWASDNFFDAGLSAKQAQTLVQKWGEFQAGIKQSQDNALIQNLQKGQETVQKEWGAAYEQNVKVASRAAREFGVQKEVLDKIEGAIGFDGVMKLFHSIGSKIGESSFVQGELSGGFLSPAQALDKISALRSDGAWVKRYTEGDAGARKEMESLMKMAHHGEMTL